MREKIQRDVREWAPVQEMLEEYLQGVLHKEKTYLYQSSH